MTDQHLHFGAKAGTLGGTVLGLAINIQGTDIIRTIILATVGAIVSFTISILLRWIVRAWRRRKTHIIKLPQRKRKKRKQNKKWCG